ncbi:MAG: hypothetical protein M3512_12900 [Bacteroidota bacterium]|nr:hypothetical protein [Bacteroidota bacterium]
MIDTAVYLVQKVRGSESSWFRSLWFRKFMVQEVHGSGVHGSESSWFRKFMDKSSKKVQVFLNLVKGS